MCMIQNRHLFMAPILIPAEAVDFRIIFSQQTSTNSGKDVGCAYCISIHNSEVMRPDWVPINRLTNIEAMIYAHSGTFTLKQ